MGSLMYFLTHPTHTILRCSAHTGASERRNAMGKEDTIRLLRECNAGVKTGTNCIQRILKDVKNHELRNILQESLQEHKSVGNRTHEMLNELKAEEKDPHPCARCMSTCKINMKMCMSRQDYTAAALIHDGCNMGIRTLCKYLNQYPAADERAKQLAQDLVDIEARLMVELRPYL